MVTPYIEANLIVAASYSPCFNAKDNDALLLLVHDYYHFTKKIANQLGVASGKHCMVEEALVSARFLYLVLNNDELKPKELHPHALQLLGTSSDCKGNIGAAGYMGHNGEF